MMGYGTTRKQVNAKFRAGEIKRLWASLLRYGGHAKDCQRPRGPECDCGWDELKKIAEVYAK